MDMEASTARRVVGGVDTHKDLHVAAVVDEHDCILGTRCFATTRQGYRQMIDWMRSFGELLRIGIESSGSYGAGLLRFVQKAGIEVLEVTTPDKLDRRRRGKNDDLDAQNAAHAAFAGTRTVTPRSRDGMVEALRVLTACRKTAVAARRVALQLIQNTSSQFTSFAFTSTLKNADIRISMDGRGRWMDNVFIERLWRSLKYECVFLNAFETGSGTVRDWSVDQLLQRRSAVLGIRRQDAR
jgi:hypothetical protein